MHIVRHPCGYVASVLRGEQQNLFGRNEAASDFELYRLACETVPARRHGITLDTIRTLTPADRLAWRWLIYNEKAHGELAGDARATTLYYEQLCAQPAASARDSSPSRARLARTGAAVPRRQHVREPQDYYSVFQDPLTSAWRWQRELDAADAERVMAHCRGARRWHAYLEPRDWNRAA